MSGEIPKRLIGRAYEMHEFQASRDGFEPCSINFLAGMAFSIGIITGSWDCGIPEGTPSVEVIKQLTREIHEHTEHLQKAIAKFKADREAKG